VSLKAVIIDTREPVWCKAMTFGDAPVMVQELPAGDAWLAVENATIAVERKGSISDLIASIADNRLFGQIGQMTATTSWAYLVITELPRLAEGQLIIGNKLTKWTWSALQGALLTVQELGAGVRWAVDDSEYRNVLKQLANRDRGNVVMRRKREAVMRSPGEEVLCSLPQISDGRAEALLRHCGSAANALVYLTSNGGGEVRGIGQSIKDSARFALGLPDWAELTIISKEHESQEEEQNE